ncbi:MAG: 3-hydroxybutyryl-CoA dehydrogenase [Ignavibacteriae bacterium]|nr:3-hydroxybutyryl-CoA dehydrogenase [Ignavibacteria bacterium]MBI3363601.1 3-hydroxybutyryl-CoA dehydrogenase [Ignavibacteriota bacterium]
MATIGIVGAGTMGGGIAHVAALSGFNVLLHDISTDVLNRALQRISTDLQKGIEKGKISAENVEQTKQRIRSTSTFDDFSPCNLVVEAAVEKLDVKKNIFSELEQRCLPDAILATNTSSLSVTAIASSVKNAERVVGMHFFNPPHLMKLVEIVRGQKSSDETIRKTIDLAKQLGKTPVLVNDTPGFIVNRCARPFYGEALRILGEGIASVEDIDRIVRLEGGFKMGPFELMDLIGIDVNFAVTKSIYEQTFGEPRYRPHVIQQAMVNAGYLGRKAKQGFYKYEL